MRCHKIAFINGKGGCGKTTSIFHVSGVLAQRKEKTLVIDFDKQKNITNALLKFNEDKPEKSILDFMQGSASVEDIVRKSYFKSRENAIPKYYGVNVLPADKKLSDETLLENVDIKDKLNDFIVKNDYKWLLVDMPPSNKKINEICFSQIVDYVIVPFTCDVFSVDGYKDLMELVADARQYNASLNILGIYIARFDKSSSGDNYIKEKLQEFKNIFIDVQIPDRADVRDSVLLFRPISYYKMISPSKTAYENLVVHMEKRINEFK